MYTQHNKPVLFNNKACNVMANYNYAIAVISLNCLICFRKILFLFFLPSAIHCECSQETISSTTNYSIHLKNGQIADDMNGKGIFNLQQKINL